MEEAVVSTILTNPDSGGRHGCVAVRLARWAGGLATGVGIVMAGLYWWSSNRFIETTDNAYVEAEISVISPQVTGYIRDLPVPDNRQVGAGDILAVLEDREYQAMVRDAEAALMLAVAARATAEARIAEIRASVDAATAAVSAADAERVRRRRDLERSAALLARDGLSRRQYDEREADARKATAVHAGAVATLAAERKRVTTLEAELREADARVRQAEVKLDLARIELDRTVIRAPVDGIVGNRGAQIGQYVRAGTVMMAVVPLDRVHVVANFKETQILHMRVGQEVRVSVDAYSGREIRGRIESLAPASGSRFSLLPPENATGNFTKIVQRIPVRIALDERGTPGPDGVSSLRPGLSVEVSVDTAPDSAGKSPAAVLLGLIR